VALDYARGNGGKRAAIARVGRDCFGAQGGSRAARGWARGSVPPLAGARLRLRACGLPQIFRPKRRKKGEARETSGGGASLITRGAIGRGPLPPREAEPPFQARSTRFSVGFAPFVLWLTFPGRCESSWAARGSRGLARLIKTPCSILRQGSTRAGHVRRTGVGTSKTRAHDILTTAQERVTITRAARRTLAPLGHVALGLRAGESAGVERWRTRRASGRA
jgi:hypothetical protein